VEAVIHLDTHVTLWLYHGEIERLSSRCQAAINAEDVVISPMSVLELGFLREIGRLQIAPEQIVDDLAARLDLRVADTPFLLVAREALALTWTRDPFDRLIVANALADRARLISADRTIRENFTGTLWS
jgi:PIN domain nuclease of toxin-antitoxin system